jgi:hypothetical protein
MFLLFLAAAESGQSPGPASSLVPVAIGVIILAAIANFVPKKRRKKARRQEDKPDEAAPERIETEVYPLAYQVRPSLLTKAERSFYGALRQAVRDEWLIFAKVRLSDIVTVPRGVAGWQTQFNRGQSKHADFILCDAATLRVVAAIELDDASHQRVDRQERDAFVEEVFATAKLPLIRVPAKQAYTIESVRSLLTRHLERRNETRVAQEEIEAAQ